MEAVKSCYLQSNAGKTSDSDSKCLFISTNMIQKLQIKITKIGNGMTYMTHYADLKQEVVTECPIFQKQ